MVFTIPAMTIYNKYELPLYSVNGEHVSTANRENSGSNPDIAAINTSNQGE